MNLSDINKLKNLKKNVGFIRYFKNTSWLFLEKFIQLVSGLLISVLVARYLGPTRYGILNYVLAISFMFGSIAKLGLDSIVVKDLVLNKDNTERLLGTAFWLKIFGSILSILFLAIIIPFISITKHEILYVFIISFSLFFQSFDVLVYYFESKVLAKAISLSRIIQIIISCILKICFIILEVDLIWFILLILFDSFTLASNYLISYCAIVDNFGIKFLRMFDKKLAIKFLNESWPLLLTSIAIVFHGRIDFLMISEYLSKDMLGQYSAAYRLYEVLLFIPPVFVTSLFPSIIKSNNLDSTLFEKRMSMLISLLFWLAVVISVISFFFSKFIISLTFGSEYISANTVFKILIFSMIFNSLGSVSSKYFIVKKTTKVIVLKTFCTLIFNVLLNYILIPKYGINGAAFSTLFSIALGNYFFLYSSKEFLQLRKIINRGITFRFYG